MRRMKRRVLVSAVITGAALLGGCGVAEGRQGDATWQLARPADVSAETTRLEVGVTRSGCAGGRTGAVLEPELTYEADRIILTTYVESLSNDVQTCQGNDVVPLGVDLDEPVGDRELVDGACLVVGAVPTGDCVDDGVRWAPSAASSMGISSTP